MATEATTPRERTRLSREEASDSEEQCLAKSQQEHPLLLLWGRSPAIVTIASCPAIGGRNARR